MTNHTSRIFCLRPVHSGTGLALIPSAVPKPPGTFKPDEMLCISNSGPFDDFHELTCATVWTRVAAQELPPSQTSDTAGVATEQRSALQIPDGTPIEIEAPYKFRSMDFRANDKISFRVVDPVKVNGVTVVEQGATATGLVNKSKRGGHWGKAGLLVWTVQSVTAVDGSQIPVRAVSVRLRGDSKGAKVATQMIITGALMPLIAPVALLHGFKRQRCVHSCGKEIFGFCRRNSVHCTSGSEVN